MTVADRTWAIRVEAPGLEDVVTGPLTRDQADALAGMFLDRDREEAVEHGDPSGRRITVEAYDPADPDLEPVIPKGAERTGWVETVLFAATSAAALFFAFHTYHLQIATPRERDMPIVVCLMAYAVVVAVLALAEAASSAGRWFTRRSVRSSRRRPAEVTS